MTEWIFGKSPILEALKAQRRKVYKFFYAENKKMDEALSDALNLLSQKSVTIIPKEKKWFEKRFPQQVTQGWAAEVEEFKYLDYAVLMEKLSAKESACLLILDHIQDPHNLGAILRVAECFGVDAVILPEDRSAIISETVVKVSAGAVEYLDIVKVTNISRVMSLLKEQGFWMVGAEAKSQDIVGSIAWPDKVGIVMGSEGKGLHRLVAQSCDFLVQIPMLGQVSSLNVSVATAIFIFDYLKSKNFSPKK